MNEEKLSSDEVPHKFVEWLLAMGCPAEIVPTADKMSLICRGQYYMVWRSLMERVHPKNVIKEKRLQVFCNDVAMCQKKTAFSQNSNVVPNQLSLWQQQKDLREKVSEVETRLKESQELLKQLMEKNSKKRAHCNSLRKQILNLQRRDGFLKQVSEELQFKKENLEETSTIADGFSLGSNTNENDVQAKVEKCVATLRRQVSQTSSEVSLGQFSANPVASSSKMSTHSETVDYEELVSSLARRGDLVWAQLRSKRGEVATALQAANAREKTSKTNPRFSPQSVVAHTASLHCSLALEAMKNRVHIKQTRARFASSFSDLSPTISGDACELFVLHCEKAHSEAKVNALRILLKELNSRSGIFKTNAEEMQVKQNSLKQIETTDKAIESKRDELKKLLESLAVTEKKIHDVKDCLVAVFNSFQKGSPVNMNYQGTEEGIQVDLPKESISTLCQFYEERRENIRGKPDLSLDLCVSDGSFDYAIDSSPSFAKELKIYLKKFNLENNKKLVFESGEKIWIFETMQSLMSRLHSKWLSEDISCSLLCPSVGLPSLLRLAEKMETKAKLVAIIEKLGDIEINNNTAVDINSISEQEAVFVDRMKKRIGSNLKMLQQCKKTLEVDQENARFWADNELRKYISGNRTVDGKTYKECETICLENLF